MIDRRRALQLLGSLAPAGLVGSGLLGGARNAQAADYRALVVLFLNGGNDGSNCLVPTDGAYDDYQRARSNLALTRASLTPLQGSTAGHTFGMHPGLSPLVPLYHSGRLAWIANVGPLVVPATAQQVKDRAVPLPPFLLSHFEQVAVQQGWGFDVDRSGWGGRGLELLDPSLRHPMAAVSFNTARTLVLGRRSPVSWIGSNPGEQRYWSTADFTRPDLPQTRELVRMAQGQFGNAYANEYARSFLGGVDDARTVAVAAAQATVPGNDFGSGPLANSLRTLATLLPAFKRQGLRRQMFLIDWGGFDTHGVQRGTLERTQDHQLGLAGKALAGFDAANVAAGLDRDVVTLVMSDFGRTLRPASGGGSDHAWGNHWWLMGGAVQGGQVVGRLPSLVLGGPDDFDLDRGGRFVPTTATDQVAATMLQWLGLSPSQFDEVLPNLKNFAQPTLPLMQA